MSEVQAVEVEDVAAERVTRTAGGIGTFFRGLTGNRVLIYSFRRVLTIYHCLLVFL